MKEKYHKVCLRCGRKLKSEESRKLGYGAVCYKKMRLLKAGNPLFYVGSKESN